MRTISITALIILLCTACSSGSIATIPVSQVTPPSLEIPNPVPNLAHTITPFFLQPTNTATIYPSAIHSPTTSLTQFDNSIPTCLNNGDPQSPPPGFGIDGAILYQDQNGHGLYSIGGTPLVNSALPVPKDQEYDVLGISGDGNWLAYSPVTRQNGNPVLIHPTLYLLSSTGEKINQNIDIAPLQAKIPSGTYLYAWRGYPRNWLTESFLDLIILYAGETRIFSLYSALDPFTGSWYGLSNLDLVGLSYWSRAGISPDRTRALYTADTGDDRLWEVILIDLTNHQILGRYPGPFMEKGTGEWTSDNSMVAYVQNDHETRKLSIVNRDGGKAREISLPMNKDASKQVWPIDITWSPDNISFAVYAANQEGFYLYIYRADLNRYVYRCPLPDGQYGAFSWSPEGRYLVSTTSDRAVTSLVVYDVTSGAVYKLVDNVISDGWLTNFPSKWP